MISPVHVNLAEQAAVNALNDICVCIEERKNFLLEAGAGAGKTETLIRTLRSD